MLWKRKLQILWIILENQNPKGLLRNGDRFNIYFYRKNMSMLILYTILMYVFDHYLCAGGGGVGRGAGPNLDTYNIEMELLVCVKR